MNRLCEIYGTVKQIWKKRVFLGCVQLGLRQSSKKHLSAEDMNDTTNDRMISISDERLWDVLFEEACVEGQQAERIRNRLKEICGDGWIQVEKGLPEQKPKEVIMCYPEGERKETHMVSDVVQVTAYNTKDGSYMVAEDSLYEGVWAFYEYFLSIYKVIAWKPKPEPYKPEKLV